MSRLVLAFRRCRSAKKKNRGGGTSTAEEACAPSKAISLLGSKPTSASNEEICGASLRKRKRMRVCQAFFHMRITFAEKRTPAPFARCQGSPVPTRHPASIH
ncbi:unnamed protein product, partial [Ectocarpus sp. 13 AM-2016]